MPNDHSVQGTASVVREVLANGLLFVISILGGCDLAAAREIGWEQPVARLLATEFESLN